MEKIEKKYFRELALSNEKKVQHFHQNPADDGQIQTKLLFRSQSRTDSLGRRNNADLKLSDRSIVVNYG
jgi:hypothetical protein